MTGSSRERLVALYGSRDGLAEAIHKSLNDCGILTRVTSGTRVALKPNLTYPYHKPGVTTSPIFIRETVRILREYTSSIAVVETDGGYGAWSAPEAFAGHGLWDLKAEYGIEVVNLCDEDRRNIRFRSGVQMHELPLPTRLLDRTDLFITMPVPKVHVMTGLTLSYKNQWGCIPDTMRLRRHAIFNDAIVAINSALKPAVLADGTYFLDRTGPMKGEPVRMDLVIGASDPGAFDRYVSELMGYSWTRVPHLKRAAALGDMPRNLSAIKFNVAPADAQTHVFTMERSMQSWLALAGFKSRFITWLGYEAWFGRVVLHRILYAIAGRPVTPQEEARSSPGAASPPSPNSSS